MSAVVHLFVIARSDSDEVISVLLLGINSTTPGLPRSFGARNDVLSFYEIGLNRYKRLLYWFT